MDSAFGRALNLILSGDVEVMGITLTSLGLAFSSTAVSGILGILLALVLHLNSFRGRKGVLVVLNGLMALPTVVIGLTVYSLLSRSGPLGYWGLLYSRGAIVIGQSILALPIITSLVYGALNSGSEIIRETLSTLRVHGVTRFLLILNESRYAVLMAVVTGFGRVVGEVGVSMMLGGNIRWKTRTITTAIALESGKGEFEQALALGLILIFVSLGVNTVLQVGMRHE
ncbi:MAG: ABC transporter permease [Spirochaetaceae bacterium]|nr:ABC transporter permease [Spirochaetaceae bacterium]MDT8299298.1 ABC transporter permease [Spirochaetaceae bacterium]